MSRVRLTGELLAIIDIFSLFFLRFYALHFIKPEQYRTPLDTGHMAFLGSLCKSGFFTTYWDLYPIKYQHNTLTLGITKNIFFTFF